MIKSETVFDEIRLDNRDLVRWRELEPVFAKLYPRTIEDVMNNSLTATVKYCGIPFFIRPENPCTCDKLPHICPACVRWARRGFKIAEGFSVYGLPAVNQFPQERIA